MLSELKNILYFRVLSTTASEKGFEAIQVTEEVNGYAVWYLIKEDCKIMKFFPALISAREDALEYGVAITK